PITNTCGFTANHLIGDTQIDVSGGTIPASLTPPTPNTCVLTIPVRASVASSGSRTNTIPANTLTANQPVTNYLPATANLTIQQALYGAKAYSPTFINAGGTSQVTITLHNRASIPLTGVTFTDTLPAGLTVSGTPAPAQCSGTVTSTVNSVTLAGGTIPANGNCTIVFDVTSAVAGVYDNAVAANTISTDQGVGHALFSTNPDLTVIDPSNLPPVRIVKTFDTNPISPGQYSRLRIRIYAPVDTSISAIDITDTLPTGLIIASPPAPAPSESCPGGTLTAVAGSDTIHYSNTTANVLAAGANCSVYVSVTSMTPGLYTNTIPVNAITTNEGRTNTDPTTANIRVTSLNVSKAFYPTRVQAGGRSVMTITLENTTDSRLTNVSLLDNLPGSAQNGIRVAAPSNASTTCGSGTVTANPGSNQVILSNGIVPAQVGNVPGVCTITVDVVGNDNSPNTPSQHTNNIPTGNVSATVENTGVTIQPRTNASAILYIENMSIGIVKGFNPVLVYGGAYSVMSVQLINPNVNTALTGIAFTDNMDPGMHLTDPVVFNTGTCGGVLSGNPGDSAFSFSGGVLPPNSTCTLTVRVVMSVNANRTNTIPAGVVTTFNGVTNPDPTAASLTNLPGVSVTKGFNPSSVSINQPSTLTITIKNTSTIPVVNMGLTDSLPGTLPDGLEVANPANETNTCGGTLTANPGDQNITLTGGGLAGVGNPGDTCVITVQVLSTRPGSYLNIIPGGAITSDGGITNNDSTEDTLDVVAYYSLGNRVWFDTNNNSQIDGTEVGADGVTVELYAADGSGNPTGAVLASQVTANGGYYRFDNLPEGDYVVVIPANQFSGGALNGYWSSGTTLDGTGTVLEAAAPAPNGDVDSDDNGTRQTSGAFSGAVISGPVTLGPSASEPTGETDADPTNPAGEAPDAFSNRTVDFGFYRQTLGDQVFVDANNNGTYDGTDTALPGATVQLFASDGVTEIPVGPDGVFGTADDANGGVTTGAGGTYLFSGLPQGNYIVRVTPPAGYISTVDSADSTDTGNPNTNTDDNDNGVGTASGAASSAVVTLTPGSAGAQNNNTVTNASGTTANPTVDFGFIATSLSITKDDGLTTVVPGSVITYTIIVTNNGTDRPSLTIVDDLPPEVTYQNASPAPTTVTPTTLTWAGISLNSGDSMTITVEVVVNSTAVGPIDNGVTVTDDIIPTLTDNDNDIDTVATNNAKSITGATIDPTDPTAPAPPALPRVLIGEIVTYQIVLDVPANASLSNLTATDRLDSGLAFVRCVSVNAGTLATNLPGGFADACDDPTNPTVTAEPVGNMDPVNQGRRITFNFGDISNPTAGAQQLVVNYEVVVLDIAANNNGVGGLNNSALWQWKGGSLAASAPPLEIIEPDMSVGKDASPRILPLGFPVTFTIDVAHTAQSAVDAYDVILTDVLPSNFAFLPGTIQTTGLAPTSTNYAPGTRTLTFFWDIFPLGQNASISFQATFVGPAPATNDTNLAWTSLPIDPQPNGQPQSLTPYNGFGNERWYDPLDATSVNNYGASASVTVDVPNALPATGFAPNQVTNLPEQPAAKTYADLGNTWLEIPALGLNLPTTGVPLTADGWDLTWLSNQVGYLAGTTFPGQVGTTALTGHVTLADGTAGPFRNLNRLYWGNQVVMHINGYRYVYEVRETRSVRPTDFSVFKNDGYTWLTLITCEDYNPRLDTYAYRYAVRAVLLRVEQDSAAPAPLRESGR
ncbi:MAG: hypothetical protein B6D38_05020, partial [Anaerolineae bacterium UTCFX1]